MKELIFLKISFPLCFAVFLASSSFSFAVDGNDLAQQNMLGQFIRVISRSLDTAYDGQVQIQGIDLTDYNSTVSLLSSLQSIAKSDSKGIYENYEPDKFIGNLKEFPGIMSQSSKISYSHDKIVQIYNLADAFNATIKGDDEFKEKCSIMMPKYKHVQPTQDEQPPQYEQSQLPSKPKSPVKSKKKKRRFLSCFGSPAEDGRPLLEGDHQQAPPAYEEVICGAHQ